MFWHHVTSCHLTRTISTVLVLRSAIPLRKSHYRRSSLNQAWRFCAAIIKAARRFKRSIFDGFIRESWFPSSLSPLHSQAAGSWSDHGGHGTTFTLWSGDVSDFTWFHYAIPTTIPREKNELAIKFHKNGSWTKIECDLTASKQKKLMGMLTYHTNCCIIEFTISSVSKIRSFYTNLETPETFDNRKGLYTKKPWKHQEAWNLHVCMKKMVRHKSHYHVFVKCWTVGHAPKMQNKVFSHSNEYLMSDNIKNDDSQN